MKAALYLRSSKDRSDVSLAAQRHELTKLAASRSLEIVRSYEDAVESGSSEDRPGFVALVKALKDAQRGWNHLLVYDTSRLARRRYIAQAIKHEAKKRGVVILYARLPADLDPVSELVIESVFEAMDEAHSIMSREKGLAGMAENVRQGWRAGGRAPMGYALEPHSTGVVREGKPVTKSKLVPNHLSRVVKQYLKARAAGTPRSVAIRDAQIDSAESTMIGVEWNALVYAGHTVWNRHAANGSGAKRRPRSEWQITRDTHPALITDAEAEAILAQLATSKVGAAVSKAKSAMGTAKLSGLLYTPEGQLWWTQGAYYRLPRSQNGSGRKVKQALIDVAVLKHLDNYLHSEQLDEYLTRLRAERAGSSHAEALQVRIRELEREKAKAAELALMSDGETFLNIVQKRSEQIKALRLEADAARKDDSLGAELAGLTLGRLKSIVADASPERLLQVFVERVLLSPDLTCHIELKTSPGARCVSVASPGGFDRYAPLRISVRLCA